MITTGRNKHTTTAPPTIPPATTTTRNNTTASPHTAATTQHTTDKMGKQKGTVVSALLDNIFKSEKNDDIEALYAFKVYYYFNIDSKYVTFMHLINETCIFQILTIIFLSMIQKS